MNTDSDHICFEQIEFAAVTDKGLSDVSILTMGEAGGHGMIVDETTIEQFMKLSMGKTIPAYLTHAGAVDEAGRPKDRLGKEIGMFSGFYRDGNKVRAKNFQFLEAFKTAEPKTHATLLEMARNFADKLGISPVLRHAKAWIMGDGKEVPAKDGVRPVEALNAFPSMRLSGLLSCDFVQQPAANVGLFEAKVDPKPNTETTMTAETILLSKHTEEITVLSTQHKDAIAALETKHKEAVTALEAKANEAIAQLAKATEDNKGLTAALAAKTHEAEESAKYDMRKAGGEALQVALESRQSKLPAPASTDAGKWAQYAELCEAVKDGAGNVIAHKDTPDSQKFAALYLSRK
jgi:protein-tyrosine-phosphatase